LQAIRTRTAGDPCSTRARYAHLVEPLSPELALVDPELAERARAHLPPPARGDHAEPVEPARRGRGKIAAIVAAIAVAAGLGGAGAIWHRYDGDTSGTPARSPNHGVAGQRHVKAPTPSREVRGGSAPRTSLRPPLRPPAFHVRGAPREPLDEITLPDRARRLQAWLTPSRSLTAANLRHWLYQHAWIVTGARFGWWHGAEALRVLIRLDRRVESRWGIGYRSEAAARRALADIQARTN
jgi:hypothetical protein